MELKEKLRRAKGNRSYADLARAAGCSPENIRKLIDNGHEPKLYLAAKLARELGVSLDWLADDAQSWPPEPNTLEGKILETVRDAMRPLAAVGEIEPDERELLIELRGSHWTENEPLKKAIKAVIELYDEAFSDGVDIGEERERIFARQTHDQPQTKTDAAASPRVGTPVPPEAVQEAAGKQRAAREALEREKRRSRRPGTPPDQQKVG